MYVAMYVQSKLHGSVKLCHYCLCISNFPLPFSLGEQREEWKKQVRKNHI